MKKESSPAEQLAERCTIAYLGTVDDMGRPYIKALMKTANEGLKTFWFCSNTSSKRTGQIQSDPNACLYFADQDTFEGLLLMGTARVCRDPKVLGRFWQPEMLRYYPEGVEDEDYCVIEFIAESGNYYHRMQNTDFAI